MIKKLLMVLLFTTLSYAQSNLLLLYGEKESNTWDITFSGSTSFQLQQMQGTGEVTFDWGDGSKTSYTLTSSDQTISHTYADTTKHKVKVSKPELITKLYMSSNAGKWTINSSDLPNLTYLRLISISGTQTINSSDLPNLTSLYLISISGTQTINSSDLPNLTLLYLESISGTQTINSSDLPNLTYLRLQSISGDISYTTHTVANNMQRFYINVSSGGLTSCEIDALYHDLAQVTTWDGNKELTIIGTGNAQRTTASDADKATIVAKGVTVTDNGNGGSCP